MRGQRKQLSIVTVSFALTVSFVVIACGGSPTVAPDTSDTATAIAQDIFATLTAEAEQPGQATTPTIPASPPRTSTPEPASARASTTTPASTPTSVAPTPTRMPTTIPPTSKPADTPEPTAPAKPTSTRRPTGSPTPLPTPIVLQGFGQTATREFTLPAHKSVAEFVHSGASNFTVWVFSGADESLLINEIGAYSGMRPLVKSGSIMLDIEADGQWSVHIRPIPFSDRAAFNGQGDSVSGMFDAPETGPWEISHTGSSHFAVFLHCAGGSDLVQNEIGPVSGSRVVRFAKGPCFWEVEADGSWSLQPRGTSAALPDGPAAVVAKAINIRSGPGTNHPVVSQGIPGQRLQIVGRNADASWWQVCCVQSEKAWVAASVVSTDGDTSSIPVAQDVPTPAPPRATATPLPRTAPDHEVTVSIWGLKLYDVKKTKAVYWFGEAEVAHGVWLIPFVEVRNLSTGDAAPYHNLDFYLQDGAGRRWEFDPFNDAVLGAAWQFQAGKLYGDIGPGLMIGIALPVDVPPDLGDVWLRVEQDPSLVMYLGNVSALPEFK